MIRRPALRRAEDGVTTVEFALIAPVMLLLLMGIYDLGHTLYVQSVLNGAIQQAARNSTIEGASTTTVDTLVSNVVKNVAPGATITFNRSSYDKYSNVQRPEDFVDVNANGTCDSNEVYTDSNGNNKWDSDRGASGNGGARDAVLYAVTVNYPRLFAMAGIAGFSKTVTVKAQTVLRNQPFGQQKINTTTRKC